MTLDQETLDRFGRRYAAAWSSGRPDDVARCFTGDGRLVINDGEAAVGRSAIRGVADEYMTAFPDLDVRCQRMEIVGGEIRWHWIMRGTNTGPGGSGNRIDISGYEALRLSLDLLIESAHGHFDEDDYRRQLGA